MRPLLIALLLAAGAAQGQDAANKDPRVCPVVPSTIVFDLGAYRGGYQVASAHGAPLGGWQACPPFSGHPGILTDDCSFSVCDLPDGDYEVRFSPVGGAVLPFSAKGGEMHGQAPSFGVRVGHYGFDATGSRQNVAIDLHGYQLSWRVEGWPSTFYGTELRGRGDVRQGRVVLSLYPGVTYGIHFAEGGGLSTLSVDSTGALAVSGAFSVANNVAVARVAKVRVTAPGSWRIGSRSFSGNADLMLVAGSGYTLQAEGGGTVHLTVGNGCQVSADGTALQVRPITAGCL